MQLLGQFPILKSTTPDAERSFKIKSLYNNDLILNIVSKSKETVQKLKFLDSPIATAWNNRHP